MLSDLSRLITMLEFFLKLWFSSKSCKYWFWFWKNISGLVLGWNIAMSLLLKLSFPLSYCLRSWLLENVVMLAEPDCISFGLMNGS